MNVENLLVKASDNVSVRRAFGAAYEKDDMLIIPVALVAGGGGGGTSRSRYRNPAARPDTLTTPDATPQESAPTDAGGGFGGLVLPAGAYVIKGDQVRWVPAVDATIVILASLALVRMLTGAWVRSRRNPRLPQHAETTAHNDAVGHGTCAPSGLNVSGGLYHPAMANFAVRLVHGPGWDPSRPIRDQDGWDEHAAFMDELVEDGFVILGGPVDSGEQTLHVVEAADENDVRTRFARDPWASAGLLRIGTIERWALWLDSRPQPTR